MILGKEKIKQKEPDYTYLQLLPFAQALIWECWVSSLEGQEKLLCGKKKPPQIIAFTFQVYIRSFPKRLISFNMGQSHCAFLKIYDFQMEIGKGEPQACHQTKHKYTHLWSPVQI